MTRNHSQTVTNLHHPVTKNEFCLKTMTTLFQSVAAGAKRNRNSFHVASVASEWNKT